MIVSASGMKAQSERLKIVSQNIANAESISDTPGGDPYRRKTISFKSIFNKASGADLIEVQFGSDDSDFKLKFDPSSTAADENGYVKLPNVDNIIEAADAREAGIYYKANLGVLSVARDLLSSTIDSLSR